MERLIRIMMLLLAVGLALSACTPEPEYKSYWDQERLKEAEWVLDRCTFSYKGQNIWFGDPVDSLRTILGKEDRKRQRGNDAYFWDEHSIRTLYDSSGLKEIQFFYSNYGCGENCPSGRFVEDQNFRGMLLTPENLVEVEQDLYYRGRRNSQKHFILSDSIGFTTFMYHDNAGNIEQVGLYYFPNASLPHRQAVAGLDSLCQEPHYQDPIQRRPISFWEGVEAIFQLPGAIWDVISLLWKD